MTQSDHCLENQLLKPCTGIVADTDHQAVNRRTQAHIDDDAMTMMMTMTTIMAMAITEEHTMSVMNPAVIANPVAIEEKENRVKKTCTVEELEDQGNQVILQHMSSTPDIDRDRDRKRQQADDISRSPAVVGPTHDQVIQANHQAPINVTNAQTSSNTTTLNQTSIQSFTNSIIKIHMSPTTKATSLISQDAGTKISVGYNKQTDRGLIHNHNLRGRAYIITSHRRNADTTSNGSTGIHSVQACRQNQQAESSYQSVYRR